MDTRSLPTAHIRDPGLPKECPVVLVHRFFIYPAAVSIGENIIVVGEQVETTVCIEVKQETQIFTADDITLFVILGLVEPYDALAQIDIFLFMPSVSLIRVPQQ